MAQLLNYIFGISTAFAQVTATTAGNVTNKTTDQIQNMLNSFFGAIPFWVTGFIVIVASFFLSRLAKNSVENKMTEQGLEEEHLEVKIVAGRTTSAIVLTIGITAGLKIAGLDLTPIIAAAAFGVGFAMQDIIMNFFAGIIILLQKRFTIGTWVKVNGTEGIIKEIQSRFTIIKKFDGTNVIVPNAELFKNQVNTFTENPTRRFNLSIGVDLYADLKEVIDTIYKSIDKCEKILKTPKPSIVVTQPGAFYNNIRIRAWVDSRKGTLRPISALMRQIHKDFYRKGWSWPYPTQTLILDKDVQPDTVQRAKDYVTTHQKKKKKKISITPLPQTTIAESNPGSNFPPITVSVSPEMKVVQSEKNPPAPVQSQPIVSVPILSTNPPAPNNPAPSAGQNPPSNPAPLPEAQPPQVQ